MEPKTLQQAIVYFADPDNCVRYLVDRRWPNGVTCPTCGRSDVSYVAKRRVWQCKSRHLKCQFSPKVGTVMEDSPISARSDWLVGESKECWSVPLNRDGAALIRKDVGYVMSAVSCDEGQEHNMKVTFYGRKVQTEYKVVGWRCARNEVSFLNDNTFTCYQTGGQR